MGHTQPLCWPCGCEPPSQEVNQSKQPWAAGEKDSFQEEIRGEDAVSCFCGGTRPVFLPLGFKASMCFTWRKAWEALLCGVHTL